MSGSGSLIDSSPFVFTTTSSFLLFFFFSPYIFTFNLFFLSPLWTGYQTRNQGKIASNRIGGHQTVLDRGFTIPNQGEKKRKGQMAVGVLTRLTKIDYYFFEFIMLSFWRSRYLLEVLVVSSFPFLKSLATVGYGVIVSIRPWVMSFFTLFLFLPFLTSSSFTYHGGGRD